MRGALALLLALALLVPAASGALPPLKAQGTRFVDGNGGEAVLKGVNLGSWLMVEPWISNIDWREMNTGPLNETALYATLTTRFGVEGRERLLDRYREHWVSDADFQRIRGLGFNLVRVPVSYRLLEEDSAPYAYKESGWRFLDRAVEGCNRSGLYCLLDLHRVPGGPTGFGITETGFWQNGSYQNRTEALWRAIAQRYHNRSELLGYDLLNEPVAAPSLDALVRVYDRLYRVIRSVDSDHTVLLEPPVPFGGPDLPDPKSMGWENVAYTYHPYVVARGYLPVFGLAWVKAFEFPKWVEAQRRWQVPILAGEVNCVGIDFTAAPGWVNGDTAGCFDGLLGAIEGNGWSWAMWTVKYVRGFPGSLWGVEAREIPGKAKLGTDSFDSLWRMFEEYNSSKGFFTPPELGQVLSKHLGPPGGS